MAYVGSAYLNVVPKFNGLSSAVKKELSSVDATSTGESWGNQIGTGMTGGMAKAGAVMGVFSQLTSAAMSAISSHVGDAISRFDTLNNYPTVMQNLGYSAEDAEGSIAKMSERLQSLPTTLNDMTTTVQGLAAITGDLELATNAGLALNDMLVASGSSTQLTSAAMEQFRQILSNGVPDLTSWRSLTTAMPGQMNQLAEAMLGAGATANDLYTALGGGGAEATVSMEDLLNTMIRLDTEGGESMASFQQQAETAAGGISTSAENMSNAITRGIADVFDTIGSDTISGVLNDMKEGISDAFSTVNDVIADVLPTAKSAYESFSNTIGDIGDVISNFTPLVKDVANALLSAAPSIATFAASFTVLKTAGNTVANFAEKLQKAQTQGTLLGKVNTVLGSSFSPVTLGITAVAGVASLLITAYTQAKEKAENFEQATEGLADVVSETTALDDYRSTIAGIGEESQTTASSVDELAEHVANSVKTMQETNDAAQEQISELNTAQSIINQYAGQTDLSAEAQGRLQWAINQVNDEFGLTLSAADVANGAYQDMNGNVINLKDSINDLIEAKKTEISLTAMTDNLTELYSIEQEAAESYASARKKFKDEYDQALKDEMEYHGTSEADAREWLDQNSQTWSSYKDMIDAKEIYDEAIEGVSDLEEAIGDLSVAASDGADDLDHWGNTVSSAFVAAVKEATGSENGLGMLKEDLRTLGVSVEDLENRSEEELLELADAYNGTSSSIIGVLQSWGIELDETALATAQAVSDMSDALNSMEIGDVFTEAGINIDDFASKLVDAGVSTEDLNRIGSENLAALAEACQGNVDSMIWFISNYNDTPILDKNGNIQVDQAELIDAQGNIYTWNGSELLDQNGNVVVDEVQLLDAQANLWTWNGSYLETQEGIAIIDKQSLDLGQQSLDTWNATDILNKSGTGTVVDKMSSGISLRDNWNSGSLLDKMATGTINIVRTITDFFTSNNAAGGIRLHADGGIARYHSDGAVIAKSAVPLDIVGEDGAEAIVPLTNRQYSQPFIDLLADGIAEKGFGNSTNNFNLTIDSLSLAGKERVWQIVMELFGVMRREGAM